MYMRERQRTDSQRENPLRRTLADMLQPLRRAYDAVGRTADEIVYRLFSGVELAYNNGQTRRVGVRYDPNPLDENAVYMAKDGKKERAPKTKAAARERRRQGKQRKTKAQDDSPRGRWLAAKAGGAPKKTVDSLRRAMLKAEGVKG